MVTARHGHGRYACGIALAHKDRCHGHRVRPWKLPGLGSLSYSALHGFQIGTSTFERVTNSGTNFMKRVTSMWILDIDACQDITMDESGVDKAVRAFYVTEPYAPRPLSDDPYGEEL